MLSMTAREAQTQLNRLLGEVAKSHEPVLITNKDSNVVLISEKEWRAIQETLYLQSIPGMQESIKEGLEVPLEACSEELSW